MRNWRPSLSELVAPFRQPRPWTDPLGGLDKGIDNVHIDVFLSTRLRERISDTVRKLIQEDVRAHGLRILPQSVSAQDLDSFREGYLGVYEATLERFKAQAGPASEKMHAMREGLALLQLSLLKCLLETVAREGLNLQEELKGTSQSSDETDANLAEVEDDLVVLTRDRHAIHRRVLSLLFRQVKDLEGGRLGKLRAAAVGEAWPFLPEDAFFNPVLSIPNLDDFRALAKDYPIACLAESGDTGWLFQTNQCISKVFQFCLPPWTQVPSGGLSRDGAPEQRERRDQGLLRGFLETEMLLKRFVAVEEYRLGRSSWLDDPNNLRLFLSERVADDHTYWSQLGWPDFQRAITSELHRCLDLQGLTKRIALIYWLPTIRSQLGRPVPFSLALDFVEGRLSRRRLAERIAGLRLGLDPVTTTRTLQRTVTDLKHLPPQGWARYLNRYLVDFLVLRHDLKLAYKTFEAMDGIRLIEEPNEVSLSRSNARLQEFPCHDELGPSSRRIRAHAVLKADLRGSTRITKTLHDLGLNPATHFSLNFFDPVNKLLPEYGAEKLFVEGDAVILAIFEYEGAGSGTTVAQACVLARKILQVVDLQNARNRRHGLPELELGLGIAFSPREPSFLYDEGRPIMISEAINQADRLSACDAGLREGGFTPWHAAFRVAEVRDANEGGAHPGDNRRSYNVNGVKIDQEAFFKLQKEIRLRQVRIADADMGDDILLGGSLPGIGGRNHWILVRYGPVREWDGQKLGNVDPGHRHFFEVVVDQSLAAQLRKVPC